MKKLAVFLFFLPKLCMGGGYIESIVVDGARSNATAGANGEYGVSYSHGSSPYRYDIFHSMCNLDAEVPYAYSYISLPLKVKVNNEIVSIKWSTANRYIEEGDRFIVFHRRTDAPGLCRPAGESSRMSPAAVLTVNGNVNIEKLVSPGIVRLSDIEYYVGNVFGDSESEALSILRQYHDKGTSTKLTPNGDGNLIIPYQCKLSNGLNDIDLSMGEVSLGSRISKTANYTIACNDEYAALKVMDFKLYGGGNQEISSSFNRQMIKIELDNGSVGEINITPKLKGSNVELLMNVTLDASLGKEGDANGSVVLRYTID